jgi:ferredoxin-thioredoxin reductase catalytic chain
MISQERIQALYQRLNMEAEAAAYHLNPDVPFTQSLVEGLLVNEERYGYWACPCRLAAGVKELDLDIICPCDYRDADVDEWGACYCALYVSKEVLDGKAEAHAIPERRPAVPRQLRKKQADVRELDVDTLPVWRCTVCGYLCARDNPPGVCPICKAKRDRFERFGFGRVM